MNAKNYIDEMDLENNKVNDLNKQLNDEINMLKNDNIKLKKIKEEYKPLKNKYEEDVGKLNEQITILTNKCQNFNSFINSIFHLYYYYYISKSLIFHFLHLISKMKN